jgi:hypothetical protein
MIDAVDEGDIRCLLSLSQTLTQREAVASCQQTLHYKRRTQGWPDRNFD